MTTMEIFLLGVLIGVILGAHLARGVVITR